MDYKTPDTDVLHEQMPTNTGTLKTLTLLTFIGCGLGYLSLVAGLFTGGDYEKQRAKAQEAEEKAEEVGGMVATMAEGSTEFITRTHDYQPILLGTTLLFTTLCLVGALQMRNLKKSGFPLYVIGEVAPVIVSAALLWVGFMGKVTVIGSAVVALVFVLLYNHQRKNLVR